MKPRRLVPLYLIALSALSLSRLFWPKATVYAGFIPPMAINLVGHAAKLSSLLVGAVFATRSARLLERGNPSRAPWFLLALWFGGFFLGQTILSTYALVLNTQPPLPSSGDALFLFGYAMMIIAATRFIQVYLGSGLPVGSPRSHALRAIVAATVFAALSYPILSPIAGANATFGKRAINVAYPLLDFIALVPTMILLRITIGFRPGKVWTVWAALLVGFVFMAAGDILFAYFSVIGVAGLDPLMDLLFAVGYFFAACGTVLQYELLSRDE